MRQRGSHAERTARTRRRVMEAVVESIAEVGYPRTTAAEISRRAGVTWGAAQHHFGDKDGILFAVVEDSFECFAKTLGEPPEGESLEKRVALFVDRSWDHFRSPVYRSTFDILRNLPDDSELGWQKDMLDAWIRIWRDYFPESRASQRRTFDLMHYAISALSGLAGTRMLEGDGAPARTRGLVFLKDTLRRELGKS